MVTRTLLAIVLALVTTAAPAAAQQIPQTAHISARGTSVVTLPPDQAWLSLSVQTRDNKGPDARRLAAAAMTTVLATLKNAGLAADAVKTTGYSLNPDYDYSGGRQRLRGFVVHNQLQVRIDDIEKVADVIDAATGLTLPASSALSVGGLRFDLKDRKAAERDALAKAVVDAMANVKAIAAGAGRGTGVILSITQGVDQAPEMFRPMPVMMAKGGSDAAVATPIEAGEIEIRAWVMVSVEIR